MGETLGQGHQGLQQTQVQASSQPRSASGTHRLAEYGVTRDAWTTGSEFDGAALNADIFGDAADGTNDGKLTTTSGGNGVSVALHIGLMQDISLVSTTTSASGDSATIEFGALYLAGVQLS